MFALYGSIGIIVFSSVLYHMSQKTLSSGPSPFAVLTVAYGVALVASFVAATMTTGRAEIAGMMTMRNWPVIVLGLAVVGIEVGVLLAYRFGGHVSTLPLVVNATVMACLIPIGLLLFKERLSLYSIVGILFIVFGVLLVCGRK